MGNPAEILGELIQKVSSGSFPFFNLNVGMGKIPGVTYMRKFSFIPSINSTTGERDIWEYGSTTWGNRDYIYPADGVAPIDTVSSSSTLDVGQLVVEGLDINGLLTQQTVQLDGQNKVVLTTPLWRSYRAVNISTTAGADRSLGFAGQIYVYEDTAITLGVPVDTTKVRAFINNGSNSTLMTQYTCPAGKTAFFLNVEPRIASKVNSTVIIQGHVRDFGGVFRLVDVGALSGGGTSTFSVRNDIPTPFSEKSDVVITADADTNATGVGLVMYFAIFDNSIWELE